MQAPAALSGIKVVQGPGRHAVAVCGRLLAQLGANIVPTEMRTDPDVLIGSQAAMPAPSNTGPIQCTISATGGLQHPELEADAPEVIIQALGGLMSTSGHADGSPQIVKIPILEVFTGIDAAASILAALRVVEAGGPAQVIDVAVWDTNASLLGTFVAQATSGKTSGYRDGARHSICAPWNAYAARDGFVMICTSSDAQWWRLLELMGRGEINSDPKFSNMAARRANIGAVDALVASWTATMDVAVAAALLKKNGIPASAIASAADLAGDAGAQPFKLSRTPLRGAAVGEANVNEPSPHRSPAKQKTSSATAPLQNIRILEIGPFTAGPLTGRSLSDLGADVVKVEPPNGEVSRSWSPRAGHVSGYFANYNVGKKSIVLDLNNDADRQAFERLLGSADVLVQNLKAGALEKLGFGAEAVTGRHPRIIYCSISGYGHDGAQDAALDTVIQAESGIMSAVGGDSSPCKVGFSIADLIAGHLAVLGILAAVRARDRDGVGQHIDISMRQALKWLMRQGRDYPTSAFEGSVSRNDRQQWVLRLGPDAAGQEIRIRELGDVFADPTLRARGMLRHVPSAAGATANVMGSPYPLHLTPPRPGAMIGEAGADRDSILREWAMQPATHGEVA